MQAGLDSDLIFAKITGQQPSATAGFRISGRGCLNLLNTLFPKFSLDTVKPSQVLVNNVYINERPIDKVLWFYFKNPKSFTGEDSFEIHCLGISSIVQEIYFGLKNLGIREAFPGEFSLRAFKNNKISKQEVYRILALSEDGIDPNNIKNSLKESPFYKQIKIFKDKLNLLIIEMEANIDFGDRDIVPETSDQLLGRANEVLTIFGNILKSIIHLLKKCKPTKELILVGASNVGKSLIFNKILGKNRSLVFDSPGVTRDIVEDQILYKGVIFKIFDTPGYFKDANEVDKIAFERIFNMDFKSPIFFMISDASTNKAMDKQDILIERLSKKFTNSRFDFLVNKSDLNITVPKIHNEFKFISALKEKNLNYLLDPYCDLDGSIQYEFPFTSQKISTLKEIKSDLSEGLIQLKMNNFDFSLINFNDSRHKISFILDEHFDLDITKELFSKFCLGK